MVETWTISVGARVYGPYSLEQMQGFHAENRLAEYSLVARAGEEQFHPADEDPALAPLFAPQPMAAHALESAVQPVARPAVPQNPLTQDAIAPLAQSEVTHDPVPAAETAAPHRFGMRGPSAETAGPSHFVIVADMKSRSITGLEEEIFALGQAHRFGPQAWVLVAEASINTIRNALVQKLGKLDTLFLVDAMHDKAAWFNFGPESDARIRKMWSRPADPYAGVEKRAVRRA